jgi:opacity protein-like surface antigen
MRAQISCLVVLVCLAPAALAQDVELFGGYSHLQTTATDGDHVGINGWDGALSANLRSWGVVADLSNFYGASTNNFTPVGSGGHGFMYLFGPQYSFRLIPHVTPFVHVLFGRVDGARETVEPFAPGGACPTSGCSGISTTPETAFAMAVGGGLDLKVHEHVWVRLIQADYIRQGFSISAVNSPRISAGVVFRLGRP